MEWILTRIGEDGTLFSDVLDEYRGGAKDDETYERAGRLMDLVLYPKALGFVEVMKVRDEAGKVVDLKVKVTDLGKLYLRARRSTGRLDLARLLLLPLTFFPRNTSLKRW